jgi:hypothetical protein
MGIDLLITRGFAANWYLTFAGSVFDARYRTWDQKDRNTRFNAQFSSALSLGKEFAKQTLSKNRLFGFNIRALYHAGYWTTPIDEMSFSSPGSTAYEEGQSAFSDRLPAYFRVDARVYFKVNRKNYTRTLSLDVQNLTNRKNISYRIYDPFRNSPVYQYQLGILPVLNYRVEF